MPNTSKPALNTDDHAAVVDVSLLVGQLMLQHGAETQLVEETMHRLGTALGFTWLDIYVSPNALVVSSNHNGQFRTKTRRVAERPVNMTTVSCIVRLVQRTEQGQHTLIEVQQELDRIMGIGHHYNRWQIAFALGLACAAFCKIFGGGLPEMAVTFVASTTAALVRQEFAKRHINLFINIGTTAFTATIISSIASLMHWGQKPDTALAAAVLLLIPGVPFINSIQDLIKGYTTMGLARWTVGTLITLSISLGMILALSLTRVDL